MPVFRESPGRELGPLTIGASNSMAQARFPELAIVALSSEPSVVAKGLRREKAGPLLSIVAPVIAPPLLPK